jgi:hypothetical protein
LDLHHHPGGLRRILAKYVICHLVTWGDLVSLEFDVISEQVIGNHNYIAWLVKGNWQQEIANEYRNLRTSTKFPLEPISLDGLEFSVEAIKKRISANTIPERRGGNFDVVRSDFGEVIAYMALEQAYGTQFGYKSVRDRELIHLPGRGIDGVGVELADKLKLVLTETKVSHDTRTPPRVVDIQEDSLRNQHLAHNTDSKTCKKIWDLARRTTTAELQNLFIKAALLFEARNFELLDVITCCVLVRPHGVYHSNDFGTFMSSPDDYHPGKIRFLIVCIPSDQGNNIESVIDEWFQMLNEGRV